MKTVVPEIIEGTHSKLGASSSERWFNCEGSVQLCEEVPPQESGAAALEGTAAHKLAEVVLNGTPNAFYYIGKEKKLGPEFTETGIKVTEEMATHVQAYADFVRAKARELGGELEVEKMFHLKHIHPDLYGTSDAVIRAPRKLWVGDFKYGAGYVVEVEENTQLLYYGTGAAMGIDLDEIDEVEVCVIQPRLDHEDGPIRSWTFKPKVLRDFAKRLRVRAIATEKKDAPLVPGKWCRWCAAAGVCPALYKTAIETAKTDFADPQLPEVRRLSDEQLAKVIQHSKTIEKWFESVREYVRKRAITGEKVPGVKLVAGRGSRRWKDEAVAKDVLEKELGEDAYKVTLLSVAQAEDKIGAGVLDELWEKIEGNPTIAHESDRRKELAPKASEDFDDEFSVDENEF